MVAAIWSWLIAAMKGVICAVIYWVVYWCWAFFDAALFWVPAWLEDPLGRFGDTFNQWYKFIDVFVPLHEVVIIVSAYWVMDLSFRALAAANSIRKT